MNDPLGVSRVEGVGQLSSQVPKLLHLEEAVTEAALERLPWILLLVDVGGNFFFSDHSLASKRAAHLEREIALNYPNGQKPTARLAPSPPSPARQAEARLKERSLGPPSGPHGTTPGMSEDEVLALVGHPGDRMRFGRRARWVYEDMTVVFEGGHVTTVTF